MTVSALGSPITILMYHSVNPDPDDYSITPQRFHEHMSLVARHFSVIALKDIHQAFPDAAERKVIVTFDDAFLDILGHVLPSLTEFRIPVTVFVPTGFVGRYNDWDLALSNVTRKRIMGVNELRLLSASGLVDFGSHTVDHLRMSKLTLRDMELQAVRSRGWLEDTLGKPVTTFSYPFGQRDDFTSATTNVLVEAGYDVAVTTCWGTRNSASNVMSLRRIHFKEDEDLSTVHAKMTGWYDWIALKERLGHISRSMRSVRLGG
jgi:peptidoglycan/xylan/chitin deacetylase (PgdA/CDA1 family)